MRSQIQLFMSGSLPPQLSLLLSTWLRRRERRVEGDARVGGRKGDIYDQEDLSHDGSAAQVSVSTRSNLIGRPE